MTPQFNFQPHTTPQSLQNAYWLARAVPLGYIQISQNKKEILNQLHSWSDEFEDVGLFDKKSTQGLIAKHRDSIIVAF